MRDSLEKTMMYLFFMNNRDTDIYKLNRSAIKYYYSLPIHMTKNMDISYFWELVIKEWEAKQKLKKNNKKFDETI